MLTRRALQETLLLMWHLRQQQVTRLQEMLLTQQQMQMQQQLILQGLYYHQNCVKLLLASLA
jgi:hypothetical protein